MSRKKMKARLISNSKGFVTALKEYRKDNYGDLLPEELKGNEFRKRGLMILIFLGSASKSLLRMAEGWPGGLEKGVWLGCIFIIIMGIYAKVNNFRIMWKSYGVKKRKMSGMGGRMPGPDKMRVAMAGLKALGGGIASAYVGGQIVDAVGENVLGRGAIATNAVREMSIKTGLRPVSEAVKEWRDDTRMKEAREKTGIKWELQSRLMEIEVDRKRRERLSKMILSEDRRDAKEVMQKIWGKYGESSQSKEK